MLFVLCYVRSRMTTEEYNRAYFEARDTLYRRGIAVGKPEITANGRLCMIDGSPLSDLSLFREAWGEPLAEELTSSMRLFTESGVPGCCDQLWMEFLAANRSLLALIKQHKEDQFGAAFEKRRLIRSALLSHAVIHIRA